MLTKIIIIQQKTLPLHTTSTLSFSNIAGNFFKRSSSKDDAESTDSLKNKNLYVFCDVGHKNTCGTTVR